MIILQCIILLYQTAQQLFTFQMKIYHSMKLSCEIVVSCKIGEGGKAPM